MPFDWTPHKGGAWSAQRVGDEVAGRVVKLETRVGKDGDETPVATVRDREGVFHEVWCGGADLRPKVAEQEPQVGDGLRVKLVEIKPLGQGKSKKFYEVEVRRQRTEPPPDPMVPEARPKATVTADELAEMDDPEAPF